MPLFNETKVLKVIGDLLSKESSKDSDYINYIFCSDTYLLKLNEEYLEHDYFTDIITFDYSVSSIQSDIFISLDRIADNAKLNGITFKEELYRILLHGVLHLCGYKDKTPEEKEVMTSKENEYLSVIYS